MNALLAVAVIALVVLLAWREVQHRLYRAGHRFTDGDLSKARQDTLTRSRHVVSGKVQEHLAPLLPEMLEQFNPRDARFVGTPVDFIVFDGLDDDEVKQVCFVEVKTGRSSLNKRERGVRNAVEMGRVSFQTVRLPGVPDAVEGALSELPLPEAPPALQP